MAVIEDPAARFSFYPWDVLSARCIRSGFFPLWNPCSGLGAPHLANLQSSVFVPFKWLFFMFPSFRALDLMVLCRLALFGSFTFMLARELGLSRPGATLSGLAVAMSGYSIKHMNMVNISTEMCLPLIMFLMSRTRARGGAWLFVLSGLAWWQAMVGGNPEAGLYTAIVAGGFWLVTGIGSDWRGWFVGGLAGPMAMGALLASAQLLPFIEYLGQGWHIHDSGLHLVAPHHPRLGFSLVSPWIVGPHLTSDFQKTMLPHVGAAVAALALSAVVSPAGKKRHNLYFLGLVVTLLALAYKLPPIGYLTSVPPLDRAGNVKFAMAGITLGFAILAGGGLDILLKYPRPGRMLATGLAASGIALVAGGLYARMTLKVFAPGWLLVTLAILLALAAAAAVSGSARQKADRRGDGPPRRTATAIAALALAALELAALRHGYPVNSAIDPATMRYEAPAAPEALEVVLRDPGHPRFTGVGGALHQNYNLLHGVPDLRSFDGLYPRRYVETMAEIEGFPMNEAVANFFSHGWSFDVRPANLDHPLLDRLSVKYVISGGALDAKGVAPAGPLDSGGGSYLVYENKGAWPRAAVFKGGAMPALADAYEPADFRDIEGAFAAESVELLPGRVEIEPGRKGTVILSDLYFPGWKAFVKGDEVRIEPAPGGVRRVEIGAAVSKVTMHYRPAGFRLGIWTLLSSLVSMTGMLGVALVLRGRSASGLRPPGNT